MATEITLPLNWDPRPYQLPLWTFFEQGGKRAIAVHHRRAGKDLLAINLMACAAMERVGLYWHVFPTYAQGKKIAWTGSTKAGRPFLSHFPAELVASKNDTEMRITLKNGSIYQVVGADDYDRLVGANPIFVTFSEYSLIDKKVYDFLRPILRENEGCVLMIFTPRGKNHAYDLLRMAEASPDWFVSICKAGSGPDCTKLADGRPVISDEDIEKDIAEGMSRQMADQEYKVNFDVPIVGAYYASQMEQMEADGRITNVPWEPKLKVSTAWDLGYGDATAIIFYQQVASEVRIIDYYENSGEGLPHYAKILDAKPYAYDLHRLPHDIKVHELGSGRSRLETLRSLGLRVSVVKKLSLEDQIEAVRSFLPRVWVDRTKCERWISAMKQYRKEKDENTGLWGDTPVHDWTSHPASATAQAAVGTPMSNTKRNDLQPKAISDYDILNQ